MNLGYAKTKLDEMQRDAESDMPIQVLSIHPLRKDRTVSLETFMDACVVYNALETNKEHAMVRCEGFNLDIYSNEPDWLTTLITS